MIFAHAAIVGNTYNPEINKPFKKDKKMTTKQPIQEPVTPTELNVAEGQESPTDFDWQENTEQGLGNQNF